MLDMLFYLILVLGVGALAVVAALFVRGFMTGTSPASAIFGAKPERRLEVVDHASIDGRRKLVLIRRDNVEHLILTGGPVDVVIETGIGEHKARLNGEAKEVAVFNRPARPLGQGAPAAGASAASES